MCQNAIFMNDIASKWYPNSRALLHLHAVISDSWLKSMQMTDIIHAGVHRKWEMPYFIINQNMYMNQNKINYAHLRQSESVYKAVFNYLTFVKVSSWKMIMRIVLICSDLLFKYINIIADPEKLSRGRGSEGYLSLLGGVQGIFSMFLLY